MIQFVFMQARIHGAWPENSPTRVHGPTGQVERWLTLYRIWKMALDLGYPYASLAAIDIKLTRGKVRDIQYEENFNGIMGAWG